MALNLLASYAYAERWDMAKLRGRLRCGRLLLDSGAFTAYQTGRKITVGEYATWLARWRHAWDHAITLDVIGDPVASRRQTRKLHARGLPVLPVFTVGDTMPEFEAMVRDCGYVAVGGMVGIARRHNSAKIERLRLLQRRAEELGGGIHALGIGSLPTLRAARCYTADASTPGSVAKYGACAFFDGRLIRQVMPWQTAELVKYRDHITGHGLDLAYMLRTKRLPGGSEARQVTDNAQIMSYSLADEVLVRHDVPAPRGADGPGTRLFVALATQTSALRAADMDAALHDDPRNAPRVWQRYGRHHVCQHNRTTTEGSADVLTG